MPEAEDRLNTLETLLRLEQRLLDALRKIDFLLQQNVSDDDRRSLLAKREEVQRRLDQVKLQINDFLARRGDITPPSDELIDAVGDRNEALDSRTDESSQAERAVAIASTVVDLAEEIVPADK